MKQHFAFILTCFSFSLNSAHMITISEDELELEKSNIASYQEYLNKYQSSIDQVRKVLNVPGLPEIVALYTNTCVSYEQWKKNNAMLMRYVGNHEFKEAKELLESQQVDPNAKDILGWPALTVAAAQGNKDIVISLLDNGADVNARSPHKNSPLIWATRGRYKDIVILLLDKGANVNAKNTHNDTALTWASSLGYQDIVDILRNHPGASDCCIIL